MNVVFRMKNSLLTVSIALLSLCLLTNCRTETSNYQSHFSQEYPNEKKIEVLREDHHNQMFGFLTGINYGHSHSFQYSFTLSPDKCVWLGLSNQVPRRLLFCDEAIYLAVTEERVLVDSLNPSKEPPVVDTTLYFQSIDDRYFFKLFGSQYFVPMDSTAYILKKQTCKEEPIPYY